jgi:60 kDa SS-A/Ro ribonucleoprotein
VKDEYPAKAVVGGSKMAKLNVKEKAVRLVAKTHNEAPAYQSSSEEELRRAVMSCLLWEDTFYEDGVSIADRIKSLVPKVAPETVASIAVEAREAMNLRHVPLLLVREMARHETHRPLVASTLDGVIQRADELTEFLAMYWKDKKEPLAAQVKKGLASALRKFNEYNLAKYNSKESKVRLRDVLFLTRAKPQDKEQAKLWKKLANDELKSPDTWEVALSGGADKKETFTRLIEENNLGALAFIRNLRNMEQAGVSDKTIRKGFKQLDVSRVLPFRFITAAKHAPKFEPELEDLMFRSCESRPKLKGATVILVDVSGSMDAALSGKSEVNRLDAATGLAMLARELCESAVVYTFSDNVVQVPARRGFALREAVVKSQSHGGTYMGKAVETIKRKETFDRLVVITDEQSHDRVGAPGGKGYVVNVATYQNGVGYGPWTHINGWSAAILDYIEASERGFKRRRK